MRAETGFRLLGVLRAAFPNRDLDAATGAMYMALLADLADDRAERAVLALCRTSKFFPSVSEILACAADQQDPLPTAGEAWDQILRAVRVGQHRRAVQGVGVHVFALEVLAGVGGLAAVATSEQIDTVRAHFFHRFAELVEKRRRQVAEAGGPRSLAELEQRMRATLPAGTLVTGAAKRLLSNEGQ